jgi:hypothetical protein
VPEVGPCSLLPAALFYTGPAPPIEVVEAAKPREFRDINRWVNSVNPGVIEEKDEWQFG